jgi:phosphatidylglycerophosphate synthase
MQAANAITALRTLAVVFVLVALGRGDWVSGGVLLGTTYVLDIADGLVARHLHVATDLGAALDIFADRFADQLLWVYFAVHSSWVAVGALPIVVRFALTDLIRYEALMLGMPQVNGIPTSTKLRPLVASTFSKSFSNAAKLALFILLIVHQVGGRLPKGVLGGAFATVTVTVYIRAIPAVAARIRPTESEGPLEALRAPSMIEWLYRLQAIGSVAATVLVARQAIAGLLGY